MRSTNSSVEATPGCLLTVAPDPGHQLVQLFNDLHCLVHAGLQLIKILPLEFVRLDVAPRFPCALPPMGQILGQRSQPVPRSAHVSPPVGFSPAVPLLDSGGGGAPVAVAGLFVAGAV